MVLLVLPVSVLMMGCIRGEKATSLETLISETRSSIVEAMAVHKLPGVAIVIVDRENILWQESFGVTDLDTGSPVTPQTTFSIQSTSKNFTAIAVMLAVQDDLLDLDTTITEYLPNFRVNSSFETSPEKMMTLRHLLNHTAGFTHEAPVGNNFNAASPSFDAHVASISETWLKFPVGDRYSYSNLGIDLAGYIVQTVSGVPFERFVKERILDPIGMHSSFVDTPSRNGSCDNCASGHSGEFSDLPDYIPLTASGGVRVSIEDGARFLQFHLNRGKTAVGRLLRSDLLDTMYARSSRDPKWGSTKGHSDWFGLGVYTWAEGDTYVLIHNGGGFGYSCSMRWYPEFGIGEMTLINQTDVGTPHWEFGASFLKKMIQQHLVSKTEEASISGANSFFKNTPSAEKWRRAARVQITPTPYRPEWKQYIGRYEILWGGGFELAPSTDFSLHRVFEHNGYLYHTIGGQQNYPEGQQTYRLVEHLPGLFFDEESGEAMDFRGPIPTVRNIALKKVE